MSGQIMTCAFLDERALVEGARQLGFIFSVRTPHYVTVSTVNASYVVQFFCNNFVIVNLFLLPQ